MLHPSYGTRGIPLIILTMPPPPHGASFSRYLLLTVFPAHQVINNAGIVSRGQFVDTPVSEARKLLEVNYLGAYMVTQVSTGTGLMQ